MSSGQAVVCNSLSENNSFNFYSAIIDLSFQTRSLYQQQQQQHKQYMDSIYEQQIRISSTTP